MSYAARPAPADFPSFYHRYVEEAGGADMLEAMRLAQRTMHELLAQVPSAMEGHRYAPGKWSIKEVVQHVNDAERVFAYRALRFARNDATPLPGFEENEYAPASQADRRSLQDLWDEHHTIHRSTVQLFGSLTAAMLERKGTAGGNLISVQSLGWAIAGHAEHHWNIITERYL